MNGVVSIELRVFRVCRGHHSKLDGKGAKLAGGRWNSRGRAVVYMSQSIALAVLENLVHMQSVDFPVGYVIVEATIPAGVELTSSEELMDLYRDLAPHELGDRWLELGKTAVLRVPSAVVPGELNYLLNPSHPEFGRIVIAPPAPFEFDTRLFAR